MIKSFIATTFEIDDPDAAVAEILDTLAPEQNLLKNSLGIVSCFSEFDETGVLKAICDALPFDCIGSSTSICASDKKVEQLMLAVMVLTSDDCDFKTIKLPIDNEYQQTIDTSLKAMLAESDEKPSLFLSYFPLINEISGDMMLEAVDKATGGIPLFGTAAVDHTMDYSTSVTILNGETFRSTIVLGGIYGPVNFSFEIASLDESKVRKQKAIITESDGNILMGVNGKNALLYLEELGLNKADLSAGMGILPLVIDYKDGTKPVTRAVFALTPDGFAVCGGAMPVGTTLGIGSINAKDVLQTTESTLNSIEKDNKSILCYSCLARFLVLEANNTAEAQKVIDIAKDTDYLYACSGGEICPLKDSDGNLKNIYHNYTIVFCSLS